MQVVVVEGIRPDAVVGAADPRVYARGLLLAQRRAVVHMEWDAARNALYTSVRDDETVRDVVAYFATRGTRLEFVLGHCPCSVATTCAHVVASVLAAAGVIGREADGSPSWERTLRTVFAADPPSLNDLRKPAPLAVELSLSAGHAGAVELSARIVRPGRSGWVGAGMN